MDHTKNRSRRLGEILWRTIETDQGYAFIADDIVEYDDSDVLERVRSALVFEKSAVQKLTRFLEKYGEK